MYVYICIYIYIYIYTHIDTTFKPKSQANFARAERWQVQARERSPRCCRHRLARACLWAWPPLRFTSLYNCYFSDFIDWLLYVLFYGFRLCLVLFCFFCVFSFLSMSLTTCGYQRLRAKAIGWSKHSLSFNNLHFKISQDTHEIATCTSDNSFSSSDFLRRRLLKL